MNNVTTVVKPKRKISKAGRRRISLAQKARWAQHRHAPANDVNHNNTTLSSKMKAVAVAMNDLLSFLGD